MHPAVALDIEVSPSLGMETGAPSKMVTRSAKVPGAGRRRASYSMGIIWAWAMLENKTATAITIWRMARRYDLGPPCLNQLQMSRL